MHPLALAQGLWRNEAWRVSVLTPRQKYAAACAMFSDILARYLRGPVKMRPSSP